MYGGPDVLLWTANRFTGRNIRRFAETYCFHIYSSSESVSPENVGHGLFQNIGSFLIYYISLQPKKIYIEKIFCYYKTGWLMTIITCIEANCWTLIWASASLIAQNNYHKFLEYYHSKFLVLQRNCMVWCKAHASLSSRLLFKVLQDTMNM